MKLKTLLLFLFLAGTSVARSLPQQVVTGTVTDFMTGEPLPGVNVLIEGTLTGVSTDLNGKFSLPKPVNGATIVVSFVGYTTEKIIYNGQSVLDISLTQVTKELDQVIVIGYGTIKKSDLTGSVASVSSQEIEKSTPVTVQAALQGRVAGLMTTNNDGSPGSEASIRIRGIGTVNNNDPLYVVDGMPIDNSDKSWSGSTISFLNPSDISSIEVLKDASAQAIYGSRGANGVILITTRKGSDGAPKITFSSSFGFENLAIRNKALDTSDFRDYVYTSCYNGYMRTFPEADLDVPDSVLYRRYPYLERVDKQYEDSCSTDWMHEVQRNDRFYQNYDLSLSGGTKDIHYLASLGYLDKRGLLRYSDYKRYSFRLNTDYKAGKFITVGENMGITFSRKNGDYNWTSIIRGAMWTEPITPVFKPQDSVDINDPDYKYNKYAPTMSGGANPVMQTELLDLTTLHFNMVGNMFAEVAILKNLKFRTSLGFDLYNKDLSWFSPKYYLSSKDYKEVSTVMEEDFRSAGWVWENTLTWNRKLKDHSITALLGYTSEYTKTTYQKASKQGTPSNDPEMQTFDAATTQAIVTGGYNTFTMLSYLARVNYSFRDKYLLTASVRRDGSSKFGPGHHWGIFPSFSLAWKIIDKSPVRNMGSQFLSSLKMRAGWGQIGNSSLPVFNAYVSQVESNPASGEDYRYIFGEKIYQGYWLKTIGTPDITWETTEQTNIGLDIALFKNSLSITADYYIRNTMDMLLQVPVVIYAGYPSSAVPYTNAGSVENKGFEIIIDYRGKRGDFSYGIGVNGSTFKNRVTSLGPGNRPIISNNGVNRTEVGEPIGSFYGYKTNGIFQSEYAVQSYVGPNGIMVQPEAHAGDIRFMNLDFDNVLDVNDKTWIGNPWPILTYGFNINLGYGAFDLVVFFQGSYGNDIYDSGRQYGNSLFVNSSEYFYKNAWKGPGTSNSIPILTTVDDNGNYYKKSGYYVEDGSYLRLKNVQLGYNLPKDFCDKVRITNGRFWLGGTNLLTFTNYHGNDPEIGTTGTPALDAGHDLAGYYPKPYEISAGLTISF